MKKISKIFYTIVFSSMLISDKVYADYAYLEGEATPEASTVFDSFDARLLMANWYKIILIAVAVLCCIGFIVSNLVWLSKKRSNDK